MTVYELTLEDADGNPAAPTDDIVAALKENLALREIEGSIQNDANGLKLRYDGNLGQLVAAGHAVVLKQGDAGYDPAKVTYLLEELGEDLDGGVYNAMFSVPKGGRRRKTRKPKRKTRLTRRR
jgi:hypothetical protein